MVNKIIKTEDDYTRALACIEKLMDAEPNTPEFDELELLSTLVELYEDKIYPIKLPDPVEAIKFRMEQLGLSQKDLVAYIGSKSKVSEVLNKKHPLTLSMIRALSKGLNIPSDSLLHEPVPFSLNDSPEMDYERFPVKEMVKKGFIPDIPDITNRKQEIIADLVETAGGKEALECCLFRKTRGKRDNLKNDRYSLSAWCLTLLKKANEHSLANKYINNSVDAGFMQSVARLSYFDDGPVLAKEYLEKHGIYLITLPHLSRTYLDGAVLVPVGRNPVIGLTLRYDRVDNFWFCLLHELAHLAKHLPSGKNYVMFDDLDLRKYGNRQENNTEQEADELAQQALIPDDYWDNANIYSEGMPSLSKVIEVARLLEVHPAIIAGRIRYETNNYRKYARLLGQGTVRQHFYQQA